MSRNRSEKLPAFTQHWSEKGIRMCEAFGRDLAEHYNPDMASSISRGSWDPNHLNRCSLDLFVGQARNEYNRRRVDSYALVAYFFLVAHAKKPK